MPFPKPEAFIIISTSLERFTFHARKSEVFGLLGPNGAGKTATIRCLLTLIPASSGEASVSGIDIFKKPRHAREVSGYVPLDVSIDGDLAGYENLLFHAKLYHVSGAARRE